MKSKLNTTFNTIHFENEILRLNGIIKVLNKEKSELQREINGIYADAVKYPQLSICEPQLERLRELVK